MLPGKSAYEQYNPYDLGPLQHKISASSNVLLTDHNGSSPFEELLDSEAKNKQLPAENKQDLIKVESTKSIVKVRNESNLKLPVLTSQQRNTETISKPIDLHIVTSGSRDVESSTRINETTSSKPNTFLKSGGERSPASFRNF